jgi:hypothetical protein
MLTSIPIFYLTFLKKVIISKKVYCMNSTELHVGWFKEEALDTIQVLLKKEP